MPSPLYSKLDTLRKDIRLLVISPGEYEAPLELNLVVVSLLQKPVYHALSYCWGDEKKTEMIQIGSESLPTTTNVIHALRRIRSSEAPLSLWIDAICIDQLDTDERGHQVRMMVDVYSQAHQVHVWLGEDSPFVLEPCTDSHGPAKQARQDSAIRDGLLIAEKLATDVHLRQLMSTLSDVQSSTQSLNHGENERDDQSRVTNAIVALKMIASLPWWRRVWILQEAILSPQDPILHFSKHTFPMNQMLDAATNFIRHAESCCRFSRIYTSDDRLNQSWDAHSTHNFATFNLRKSFGWVKDVRDLKMQHQSQKLSLFGALQISREKQTSDPRDHFYGILGLVDSFHRSQVNVDYRETIDVVFSRLIRLLTIESGDLSHLQFAVGGYDDVTERNQYNLPSWIIDFATPMLETLDHRLFHAYGLDTHREHWENRIMDLTELFVYGIEIDIVNLSKQTNSYYSDSSGALKNADLSRGKFVATDLSNWASEHRLFADTPTKSVKFWRWLLYGMFKPDDASPLRRAHPDDLNWLARQSHGTYMSAGTLPKPKASEENKIGDPTKQPNGTSTSSMKNIPTIRSFRWVTIYKTLQALRRRGTMTWFVTRNGYLGAAPRGVTDEHRVFVLSGVPAPVLLRPLSDEEESRRESRSDEPWRRKPGRGNAYRFAGLCYLDGFMDGEAVPDGVEWETVTLC